MGAERRRRRMRELLQVERSLWAQGVQLVGGCDEVGVGPLAGPVVAAVVVIPPEIELEGVNDSKLLTPLQRERLADSLERLALAVGIGIVEAEEVDRMNVLRASLEAMRRAVRATRVKPEHLLVDARTVPDIDIPQTAIVDGDAISYAVAAASIVAKVKRDAIMRQWHETYPQYGFARNMGYGTPEHLRALAQYGPCPLHRRSFAPVRQLGLFQSK
ncbi:MAG: ribonuclease HII [Candidatus Binatia bacterium]|nr:ribonuclease HII [Candidatus Binatia bacterium]